MLTCPVTVLLARIWSNVLSVTQVPTGVRVTSRRCKERSPNSHVNRFTRDFLKESTYIAAEKAKVVAKVVGKRADQGTAFDLQEILFA